MEILLKFLTGLYVSSRTLFSLAQKYGTNYMKNTLGLGKTNAGHTPTPAIICCSILGCIAFLSLTDPTYDLVSHNPVLFIVTRERTSK